MEVAGIILAGGHSSRMGRDKSLLLYNDETFIERTVKKLRNFAAEIIIASNHTAKYKLPGVVEVPDIYPGLGPLAGMHAGLIAAKHDYSFIISCDMPFFTERLAIYLLNRREGYDAVVPQIEGCWEPLCAAYSKSCIGPIEDCLKAGVRKVYGLYPQIKVLKIKGNELRCLGDAKELFCNINTPGEYQALET